MTWQLTPDEIVKNWKMIQYGALMASATTRPTEYSLNLLKNLLIGKYQCWFIIDKERKVKWMLITRIFQDHGEIGHLFADPLYGFLPTTEAEQKEGFEVLIKFARKLNLESILAIPSNPRAVYIVQRLKMTKLYDVYQLKLGE
jgi:hypothetical protein